MKLLFWQNRFLKSKALFQIFLVVTLSFFTALSLRPVSAQESSGSENTFCCQETTNGQFCQEPEESQRDLCSPGSLTQASSCAQSSFCRPGCCDLGEQGPFPSVSKSFCDEEGGFFLPDASCNYPQFQEGCCFVGNDYQFVTENVCAYLTDQYGGDLNMEFRRDISSELACSQLALQNQEGCCVVDGRCVQGSSSSCHGQFFSGDSCSILDTSLCPSCQGEKVKTCVEGSSDIYWQDSCGNLEDVAEHCDYSSGFSCSDVSGEARCVDLNCYDIWDNTLVDEDYDGNLVGDFQSEDSFRVNGESWCEYDADAGPGVDLPGSRHFRHYCYNGAEYVEECKDYRDELCFEVKDSSSSLTAARCSANRFDGGGISCFECEDQNCCEDNSVRDCLWVSSDYKKSEEGICISLVPPGTQFWDGDDKQCSLVDLEVKTVWQKITEAADYNLVGNKEAYSFEFAYAQNLLCRAQGDCGAHYNLVGVWSNGGFERTCPAPHAISGGDKAGGDVDGGLNDFGKNFKVDDADNLIRWCKDYTHLPEEKRLPELEKNYREANTSFSNYRFYTNTFRFVEDLSGYTPEARFNVDDAKLASMITLASIGVATFAFFSITGFAEGLEIISLAFTSSTTALAVAIIATVVVVAAIILSIVFLTGDKKSYNVEFQCSAWQAPLPSEQSYCDFCHQAGTLSDGTRIDLTADGLHECTRYLCKSLGAECELYHTNDGSKCVNSCEAEGDVNSPILKPLPSLEENLKGKCRLSSDDSSPEVDCEITEKDQGYTIGPFVKAHTELEIGVETCKDNDCGSFDFAECRYGTTLLDTFDAYPSSFQTGGASFVHNLSLKPSTDLVPGQEYSYYISCMDKCGNPQGGRFPPYQISFIVAEGPDLSPPRLLNSIPPSGAAVAVSEGNSTMVTLLLNEKVSSCKWSDVDVVYENMKQELLCPEASSGSYQECYALVNLTKKENLFFFRCEDLAGNVNKQSISLGFSLSLSDPLKIDGVRCLWEHGSGCDQDIASSNVSLEVTSSGGYGDVTCGVGQSSLSYPFLETGSTIHKQVYNVQQGLNEVPVYCRDSAYPSGNVVKTLVNFTGIVDKEAPVLQRVYSENGLLVLETNEKAECQYVSGQRYVPDDAKVFDLTDGTEHKMSEDRGTYYSVLCTDVFGNALGPFNLDVVR